MSRDPYSSSGVIGPGGGTRSPRSGRRVGELPTVDRSPSRSYASGRGSPLGGRKQRGTRSGNNSPEHLGYGYHHHQLGSPYYSRDEDLGSPVMLEERGRSMSTGGGGGGHHRSRSASRPAMSSSAGMVARYTSLDRASAGVLDHDREFVPIREPSRERGRDRGLYLEDELYGTVSRSARQSPNPHILRDGGGYIGELQHQNNDLQRELGNLKKELELTNQKLGSSMHSIKTFWSPELKKERALRKEESTKYSLINEQLKLLNSENQKQSIMVRQLEEELRMRMRGPSVEMQQQMEVLYNENEHLTREIAILRDTIKELELRIETQKQTLQARDESIKKLLEMLQNKGMGKEEERIMFQQMQSMAQKQELKATNESLKSLQTQLELAYASTASSGQPVIGGSGISGLAGASVIGLGSVSGGAGAGGCGGGTVLGGSVAVPGGVPGSTTLTAIMETKDARITTLEKEVVLLEAQLQRIKECGGRLREQLLRVIAVPNSGGITQQLQQQPGGIVQSTGLGGQQQPGTLALARGPSMMTSLVPYGGHASSAALTSSLLAGSTGGHTTGSGGGLGVGGGSSCLAGISSGTTTGVVNPYTDRYATDHHPHQLHHHQHHHHHHLHQQHQLQLQQQQQQMQQHLKQIEPAAAGALALHAHTFNKHDLNFKRQLDELRTEVQRRDQELLAMSAKMKTLEEQHQDYQRHIAVLKESLCAKEEHYNMLQADVEEMRQRLEEKNRMIEKKTQAAMQAQQERNRMNTELTEIKDHMDIKDRKINVLQRKVDLHEANKKLQAGAAKAGADTIQERKQMDEQRRHLDEQRRQTEERAKSIDQKARTVEEKERTLQNLDQDLKKRKARMDQLEQQLQKSGGAPDKRLAEMQKALETAERDLEKAKEESGRSAAETERLLQLVQMTQEEQNSKEKQIRELQDALKTAQAKLKQATTAQQESQDNKDESSWRGALEAKNRATFGLERTMRNLQHDRCKDLLDDTKHVESWKEETETMNLHIVQLEQQSKRCEGLKDGHDKMGKDIEMQTKACRNCCNLKDQHILALERQVAALRNTLKDHAGTAESLEKGDSDEKVNGKVEESWKRETEAKGRRIAELEQKVASLESLLRGNVNTQRARDLERTIDRKSKRIAELEDAVEELEGFLKEDVKEMRDLRYQVSLDKEHIVKMEKWIQKNNLTNAGIDKARIVELEEMVTSLEDYVREHDVDGLKRRLQDRECRIDQLEKQVSELKKLPKFEENKPEDTSKEADDGVACELDGKEQKVKDIMHAVLEESNRIQGEDSLKVELREKERKMKEMGHDISEKDNRIQRYEQQIIEQQNKILKMEKEMAEMEEELYETEDINALKEEIRLRNERVQELEMEVNSLETSLGERIDVAIEELIATLKEKEETELQLKKNLADKECKLEKLDAALRQSVAITDEIETKFKYEKKLRQEADQRIAEIEEKIAVMQAASATKCITCKPLLYKIFKTEEKLVQSNEEKTIQLQELHQIKREALKAALSEKDAHLALLEHSGITSPSQADQATKLKADKRLLLDKLREEDEKSIKLDFKRQTKSQLFQKIFKISDSNEDNSDNNNNSFDDRFGEISSAKSIVMNDDSSPESVTTSCKYSTRTSMASDLKDEDQSRIHQQDTR